jgi:hypothetical protein
MVLAAGHFDRAQGQSCGYPHPTTIATHFMTQVVDACKLRVLKLSVRCQAITRAKRALWVCGNAATLRSSDVWDALVE